MWTTNINQWETFIFCFQRNSLTEIHYLLMERGRGGFGLKVGRGINEYSVNNQTGITWVDHILIPLLWSTEGLLPPEEKDRKHPRLSRGLEASSIAGKSIQIHESLLPLDERRKNRESGYIMPRISHPIRKNFLTVSDNDTTGC